MSLDVSQGQQAALQQTLTRRETRVTAVERRCALLTALVFLAGEGALLLARPPHSQLGITAFLSTIVLAVAVRVRIDTPLGFTAPTQLAFVPLLFAVPLALVPVCAMVALGADALLDVARGRLRPSRLVWIPGNAIAPLGPVAVFIVAGVAPRSAGLGILLAAFVAQVAVDASVSAVRDLITRGITLRDQLSEAWVYGVDAALSPIALLVAVSLRAHTLAVVSLLPLLALLHLFASERRKRLENTLELSAAYRGTALVLGDVIEADDGYTGEHSQGVVALALAVGEELGVAPDRQRNLEFGALLHDVGKVAIPKEIINKPGKLNPHEWTIIKTHTLEGQRMLDRVGGFMREVGKIVRSHHERWDGGGYPDGLAGEAIPVEARIITACDSWNAMRTDRAYRQALAYETAISEIVAGSGSQFDPTVVETLLRVVAREARQAAAGHAAGEPTGIPVESPAGPNADVRASAGQAADLLPVLGIDQ